ncbi:hypothetical protein Aasi_0297 [Candidatus Amoebophilus asiaticus 5a2]|uniref:Uncharacterized protein n=1 Tax=Amoebophilus asiaticus (strain 5a2) TaxID=452471 RepID=B3ER82_AMOA5|nr:hypothetical protein [Candidatus Amoebophilus asiaticus]ACE05734.1 hypothetical protein Aasi_0297 [Candidatus Amoebophilus asiaticus 5a2]
MYTLPTPYKASISKYLLIFLLLLIPIYTYAIDTDTDTLKHTPLTEKSFILDHYGSPYATASWLRGSRNLLNELEDKYISDRAKDKFFIRWSTLVGNNLCNDLLMLFAHEVNGHGFRQRSFKKRVDGYELFLLFGGITSFFTPVNGLGAITHYNIFDELEERFTHTDKELLKIIAGNEANAVLANELLLKNFKAGSLDYRNYNLFFKAFTNLLGYIVIADNIILGDDILHYLSTLKHKHDSDKINLSTLRSSAAIFFLNPVLYVSIWSFYAHLFKKEKVFSIPRLTWKNIAYMPIIRIGLTPFGISYYLDNFINNQEKTFLISLNIGKSPFYTQYYGGIGCKTDELFTYKNYTLDLATNLWYQPKLVLEASDTLEDKSYWGGLIGIYNKLKVNSYLSLHGNILYKTSGFLEGMVAERGFIWQAGFCLSYTA